MFRKVKLHDKGPYKFRDVWKFEFGHQASIKAVFGKRGWHESNPHDIEIKFHTPNHQEKDIRFDASDQINAGGDRILILSDHSGAVPGDEGVIDCNVHKNGPLRAGHISAFVNDTSEDPKPVHVYDSKIEEMQYRYRDTWMKPDTTYYLRLYRTDLRKDGKHTPLEILYQSLGAAVNEEEFD